MDCQLSSRALKRLISNTKNHSTVNQRHTTASNILKSKFLHSFLSVTVDALQSLVTFAFFEQSWSSYGTNIFFLPLSHAARNTLNVIMSNFLPDKLLRLYRRCIFFIFTGCFKFPSSLTCSCRNKKMSLADDNENQTQIQFAMLSYHSIAHPPVVCSSNKYLTLLSFSHQQS